MFDDVSVTLQELIAMATERLAVNRVARNTKSSSDRRDIDSLIHLLLVTETVAALVYWKPKISTRRSVSWYQLLVIVVYTYMRRTFGTINRFPQSQLHLSAEPRPHFSEGFPPVLATRLGF